MPNYKLDKEKYKLFEVDGKKKNALSKSDFEGFNVSVLGLGDLKLESEATDSIAAMFDLEGFTNFCKQIEPHLSVPLFLSEFLTWLMEAIREEMRQSTHDDNVVVYSPLPYFVKFMGDGLLVLWDSAGLQEAARRNIIVSCRAICQRYKRDFLPALKKLVVEPPTQLRCGVARGTVYSVGGGEDYVGSCINMAARLQKIATISFAFNRRGFDIETQSISKFFSEKVVVKKIAIRGIGGSELIGILKEEFATLSKGDAKLFTDP